MHSTLKCNKTATIDETLVLISSEGVQHKAVGHEAVIPNEVNTVFNLC